MMLDKMDASHWNVGSLTRVANDLAVPSYQVRVDNWIQHCFGPEIGADKVERNWRFIEEALELVQAAGCSATEAHQLVDYVFGRSVGEINQEVGGVMNTLAAFCNAHGVDMDGAAETELARVWTKTDAIRAKQAAKPQFSPLPEHPVPPTASVSDLGKSADACYTRRHEPKTEDRRMTHGLTPGTDALRAALKPGIYSDTTAQIRAQFRAVAIAKRLREAGFMVIRTKLLTDLTDALTDEGPADWPQEGLDQMRRDVAASFPDGACPEWLAAYARQD